MLTGSIVAPGIVRQSGNHHRIIFGELDGTISDIVKMIETAGKAAGIDAVVSDNINKDRWREQRMTERRGNPISTRRMRNE